MIYQLAEARQLIKQAVTLMTQEQLSQWQGVRAWLERPANNEIQRTSNRCEGLGDVSTPDEAV
jgi:hypothetical protein